MKELVASAAVLAVFLLTGWFFFSYVPASIACHARWSDSGHDAKYGAIAGCQVKVGEHYLPERAFRQVTP
jgi:hypothetical protein